MRVIEQESWPRREHFELYSGFDFPHVNICVQVDVNELWRRRKLAGAAPTVVLVYVITKAVNRIAELRQRIRGEEVVEHEIVHPSVTVLGDNDLFGLATLTFDPSFETFATTASEEIERARADTSLKEFPRDLEGRFARDDLISITILPWLAFTSFAITRPPVESIPLVAFGRVHETAEGYRLPFFVNIHHALADGVHIARLVKHVEDEARAFASALS